MPFARALIFMAKARSQPVPNLMRWYLYNALSMAFYTVAFIIGAILLTPGGDGKNSLSDGLFGMYIVTILFLTAATGISYLSWKERSTDRIYSSEIVSVILGLWFCGLLAYTIVAHSFGKLLAGSIGTSSYLFIVLITSIFTQGVNVYLSKVIVERIIDGESPWPKQVQGDVIPNAVAANAVVENADGKSGEERESKV